MSRAGSNLSVIAPVHNDKKEIVGAALVRLPMNRVWATVQSQAEIAARDRLGDRAARHPAVDRRRTPSIRAAAPDHPRRGGARIPELRAGDADGGRRAPGRTRATRAGVHRHGRSGRGARGVSRPHGEAAHRRTRRPATAASKACRRRCRNTCRRRCTPRSSAAIRSPRSPPSARS